jgi:hypothetical protein
MRSAAVPILYLVVAVDCATAGRLLPWPAPKDFWRVCFLLGAGCTVGILTGLSRRGWIGPPDGCVALVVAAGFLLHGLVNLLCSLTH